MKVSVIIIDDSENYLEIIATFLKRNDINVIGTYTHKEFSDQKPVITPDIALISFRTNYSFTNYTIYFLRTFYKETKVALLLSDYDPLTKTQIASLDLDGGVRKAADDASELLIMVESLSQGQKYFNL